jgi:hypothetical protein
MTTTLAQPKKRKRRNFSVILFPPYLLGKKLREKKCLVFHPRIFSYHLSLLSPNKPEDIHIHILHTYSIDYIMYKEGGKVKEKEG